MDFKVNYKLLSKLKAIEYNLSIQKIKNLEKSKDVKNKIKALEMLFIIKTLLRRVKVSYQKQNFDTCKVLDYLHRDISSLESKIINYLRRNKIKRPFYKVEKDFEVLFKKHKKYFNEIENLLKLEKHIDEYIRNFLNISIEDRTKLKNFLKCL